jgi:hypothetical protein
MYKIGIEDKDVRKLLKKNIDGIAPGLADVTNKTGMYGQRIVRESLPKRSGLLRNQYIWSRVSKFSGRISPQISAYADAIEGGNRSYPIYPRRRRYLLIPTSEAQLTPTKAALRAYQVLSDDKGKPKIVILKNRNGKLAGWLETTIGRLLLMRWVNHPAKTGQFNIRDKALPKTQVFYNNEIDRLVRSLL